jgi:hypothetical protein
MKKPGDLVRVVAIHSDSIAMWSTPYDGAASPGINVQIADIKAGALGLVISLDTTCGILICVNGMYGWVHERNVVTV